ncbi:MAG TPA: hydroxyisourate hydrolase [Pyrinomonadaceae bacterium]|nr:hydroxyisourate hydrolase [Pyrinomonadaceae bacterium]
MSGITTHVLDTSCGRPAQGVPVTLEIEAEGGWKLIGKGTTNADGRITDLVPSQIAIAAGMYRLVFDTDKYFSDQQTESFYPQVTIIFRLADAAQHYHVPLLLSPFGYSTYRGS